MKINSNQQLDELDSKVISAAKQTIESLQKLLSEREPLDVKALGSGMTLDLFIDFRWVRILNFDVRQNLRWLAFVFRQFHERSSRIVQVSDRPQP
jgi:hypothetical protein